VRGRFSSLRHAAALLVAITAAPAAAGEKSGVEPTAVSLPGGPGSIEGLGESFEPALATGTAKHRVGIALPPGVAGHTPNLSLSYDGGFANGPLGYGWECGPGTVKRQCERGVPRYREPGEDDTFLGADGVELVELENGSFLSRLEGGFTRYRRVWADRAGHPELFHWEAHSRDGARHEFGRTEAARVSLPAAESPSGRARIHSWLLERVTDVHGNAIEYRHGDLGRPVDRQKYLLEVRYGPGAAPWAAFHFARLEYEDRPDWFSDCRAGFAVRTGKRLRAIHIGIQGALPADTPGCARGDWNGDGVEDALIRRYELLYEGHRHWSLLSQVTLVGSDGVSSLPPAAFRYGALDADLATERTLAVGEGHLFASQGEPLEVLDSERVDLLDLNSDGLPDLLQTTDGVHHAYYNLGLKEGGAGHGARLQWSPRSDPVVPEGAPLPEALGFGLGMENVHLADMDADGVSDLVVTEGEGVTPGVRYFKNLGGGAFWGKAVRMSIAGTAPPPPY
jgi:hypothetical protein